MSTQSMKERLENAISDEDRPALAWAGFVSFAEAMGCTWQDDDEIRESWGKFRDGFGETESGKAPSSSRCHP